MSVRIEFAQQHNCYTNLDYLEGRIHFSILQQETIASITVKLEGESRTRLAGMVPVRGRGQYDGFQKDQTQLEVHKLLYNVQVVFPTPDIAQVSSRQQYTLTPGQYAYPFKFRLPLNNNCTNNSSLISSLNSMRMDMSQGPNAHVRKMLPPSLGGLPGEAEIQYYVKATVQRPAFYKENFRAHKKFLFLPIEPKARPPPTGRETYGRRSHQFAQRIQSPPKGGLFRKPSAPSGDVAPPSITVEARLPDPALAFCNQRLPLRILVTKQTPTEAVIYLQSIHIKLLGYTGIRAHDLKRTEATSWPILDKVNLREPVRKSTANPSDENVLEIDSIHWNQKPIPNTVTPTFDTCNLARSYTLEIKVGLGWGSSSEMFPDTEISMQQILMPVTVWSGIPIPQALLDAAAGRLPPRPAHNPAQQGSPFMPQHNAYGAPTMPVRPPQNRPSDHIEPSPEDIPPDAPPTYEEALADGVGPIDGPRGDYHQTQSQGLPNDGRDEKT